MMCQEDRDFTKTHASPLLLWIHELQTPHRDYGVTIPHVGTRPTEVRRESWLQLLRRPDKNRIGTFVLRSAVEAVIVFLLVTYARDLLDVSKSFGTSAETVTLFANSFPDACQLASGGNKYL